MISRRLRRASLSADIILLVLAYKHMVKGYRNVRLLISGICVNSSKKPVDQERKPETEINTKTGRKLTWKGDKKIDQTVSY